MVCLFVFIWVFFLKIQDGQINIQIDMWVDGVCQGEFRGKGINKCFEVDKVFF